LAVLGVVELPQNWQAGLLLLGFGTVFLMSVSEEGRERFVDFFWGLFKNIVETIIGQFNG
jgi:hypothetical protein